MKGLPKTVQIPKRVVNDETGPADYLSDRYGFCIFHLQVEKKGKRYYATNINWDTTP